MFINLILKHAGWIAWRIASYSDSCHFLLIFSFYLLIIFLLFFLVEASRASALYRTRCGYRQTMTFTRPPGTEWRSSRRITRTNGKDTPWRSGTYSRRRPFDPPSEGSLFFLEKHDRFLFFLFSGLSSAKRRGIVNNPCFVVLLLQTFARRYGLLTDVRAIHEGIYEVASCAHTSLRYRENL